jgi:two-component system chemotaxis response regulator CheY
MSDTTEVLIVEDDENMRTLLSHFMQRENMETILQEDGQGVRNYISEHPPPDIALVDLHLPYVSGFDLIKKIRETEGWEDIPVIVISSESTDESVEKALSMGANDYIEKPVEMKKTMARIKRFLN